MKRIAVDGLPGDPLAAAALFHGQWLPLAEDALAGGDDAVLVLPSADHTHREWRRAIVVARARKHAPRRINMIAGEGASLAAIESYLATAPGVTGQYLEA